MKLASLSTLQAVAALYNPAFSPSAPQVESCMDHALTNADSERPGTTLRQGLEVTLSELQETQARITKHYASAEAKPVFNIPVPAEVSESGEDEVLVAKPVPKRCRSSKTSTARKLIVPAQGRGDTATAPEPAVDPRTARRQKTLPSSLSSLSSTISRQ